MPLAAETLPAITPEQYLAFERESERRHELVDGYLYAMTGASDRHEEIAGNLLAAIHAHLRGSGCRVYGANLKLRVGDDFFYPDLFLRCAEKRGDPYFKTDPVLVVEVLSPNTQRHDRGDKRLAYQSFPTLREYALVAQDSMQIDLFRRTATGWQQETFTTTDSLLELDTIGLRLPMREIYA
jgi:Uma2 family endonuclease